MNAKPETVAKVVTYLIVGLVAVVSMALFANGLSSDQKKSAPPSVPEENKAMVDTFDGTKIDEAKWVVYDGSATNGRGTWSPSQVRVENGQLLLIADGSKMGGLCMCGPKVHDIVYGDVSFTLSIEKGKDVYLAGLMWPQEPEGRRTPWPVEGEIDIIETNDPNRQSANYNIWWGSVPDDGTQLLDNTDLMRNKYPQFSNGTKADFTQPQKVRLEWRPDHISIFHAGNLVFRTDDPEILNVMVHPMHLALQLDMPGGVTKRTGTVVARIDNVSVQPVVGVTKLTKDGPPISAPTGS